MPEYAEVKLERDNINSVYQKLGPASNIEVYNTNSRVATDFSNIKFPIHYKAESRGKELKLILRDSDNKTHTLVFTLGMSGKWIFDIKKYNQKPQQKHVRFLLQMLGSNSFLGFHDVRRFGYWKFRDWKKSRSPDPVEEYKDFRDKIYRNLDKSVKFEKPIAELLLDQSYFNGIGNYLRASILYHTHQNPFENAREAIKNNTSLISYCKNACAYAYMLQLKMIKEPSKIHMYEKEFNKWKFYKRGLSCKDNTGRTLWFDEKWKDDCPYEIKNEK